MDLHDSNLCDSRVNCNYFYGFHDQLPIGHHDPKEIYSHTSCPLARVFSLCYPNLWNTLLKELETLIIIMINIISLSTVCKGYGAKRTG